MFPHKIDRYRIIQRLTRMERRSFNNNNGRKGIDQKSLANKAGVSQAVICNLKRLEGLIDEQKRMVSRHALLKALTSGLGLEQKKADTILWLYDGAVLDETEINDYVKVYLPCASPGKYTYNTLRNYVLEILTKAFGIIASESCNDIVVKTFFTHDGDTLIQSIEALVAVESIPGHSVMVSRHPPFLARRTDSLRVHGIPKNFHRKMYDIHEQRRMCFFNSIKHYGYRGIHQKSCIEMYLGNDHPYRGIKLEERLRHVREWVELLKSYPYYEVGLADNLSDTEIFNKCNKAVVVRGTPLNIYPDLDKKPFTGLRFIHYADEVSTLRFFLECERTWDNIAAKDRTKATVIEWLECLLRESECQLT